MMDAIFESDIRDNAELQRRLFPARVSFEFAINEIENRRTAARLKRRFADVCPDFLDAAAKLTEKPPMPTPLDDDGNSD